MDHLSGKSIQRTTILKTVSDDNLSLGNHRITNIADAINDQDAVTKKQLDEAQGQASSQSLNQINSANPLTSDLDLRNNNGYDLLINPATSDDNPITKQQLDTAISSIETGTTTIIEESFQEAVTQSSVNTTSQIGSLQADIALNYAKIDSLTRAELSFNPRFCGGDLFMSSEWNYDPNNPPLFPKFGGIYGLRDSDLSDNRWVVQRQAIPRIQIQHLIGVAKNEAIEESKQAIADAIVDLDIPADQSAAITDLQNSKRNKADTLQTIQDTSRAIGHVSFLNPLDYTDASSTVLVASHNYRDFNPGEDPNVDPYRAANQNQLLQLYNESVALTDRVTDLENTVDNLPITDQTKIQTDNGLAKVSCTGDNNIEIFANNSSVKLGKLFAPTGQTTQNLGISADQKLQLISNTGSFSLTSSAVQVAQPGINTCGIYCGMTDDQSKNQVTQLVLGTGNTCHNLTLASQHYNLGSGMQNVSTISNQNTGIQQAMLISSGTPLTNNHPTIGLYQQGYTPIGYSTPIQFNTVVGYATSSQVPSNSKDLVPKSYCDTSSNSWQNTVVWREFYNNVWKYLLTLYSGDPDTDSYYWNNGNQTRPGLMAKFAENESEARSNLYSMVTSDYQTADQVVTTAFQTADTGLQTQITTHGTQLSGLNSRLTIAENTNVSQQTLLGQHTTDLTDHENRITVLEDGSGGGGGGGASQQDISDLYAAQAIVNRYISKPLFRVTFTNPTYQGAIAHNTTIQYSPATSLTIQSQYGTFDDASQMITVNGNNLQFNLTAIFNIINTANVSKLYDKTASLMNWNLHVIAKTEFQGNPLGSAGASCGVKIRHSLSSNLNDQSGGVNMNQSATGDPKVQQYTAIAGGQQQRVEWGNGTWQLSTSNIYYNLAITYLNNTGTFAHSNTQTELIVDIQPRYGN